MTDENSVAEPVKGYELIEGDEQSDDAWREYPLDSLLVRQDPRTVRDVIHRIGQGRYKLDPDFQRDFVWDEQKQSRLIESCLMRIPLPVFYLAEDLDGKIIVVDGLQRLTTLKRFLDGEFALKLKSNEKTSDETGKGGLSEAERDNDINGKKFSELSFKFQDRIEDTVLQLYILDAKAPERAKLDIFDRVNSGVPLTRQQMRNSLYSGAATHFLKQAAESEHFKQATGEALAPKQMRDREVVNRFCAFYLIGVKAYKGEMDDILASALRKMNKMSAPELEKMMLHFLSAMELSYRLFGKHSFRKSLTGDESTPRAKINISLFDALSIPFACYPVNYPGLSELALKSRVIALLKHPSFDDAIRVSTSIQQKVNYRHEMIKLVLEAPVTLDAFSAVIHAIFSRAGQLAMKSDVESVGYSLSKSFSSAFSEVGSNVTPTQIENLEESLFTRYSLPLQKDFAIDSPRLAIKNVMSFAISFKQWGELQ